MVGSNSLLINMRVLTLIKLFLNASVYLQHPCFLYAVEDHNFDKTSINSLLAMCVSFACVDSGLSEDALAKREAILNCCNKE